MAIDSYIMDVRNPFEQSLAGVQTALQISGASRDRQLMEQRSRVFQAQEAAALAEAQAKQEQMKQDQAMQEEMAKVAANPTMANVRSMLIRFPSMKDSLGKAMESLSASERDARVRLAGQVNAAITAGRPDVAREIMTKQAEAYRNSNREDDAVETERFIQLMDASPGSVGALAGLMVASAGEGDKYVENLTKLEDERRAKAKEPFELSEAQAKAQKAATEAKFAESNAVMDITKKGWDITKLQEDIAIQKENARIAAAQVALQRENNALKRQELGLKVDEMKQKRDETVRTKVADLEGARASIDNLLNTTDRALATPLSVMKRTTGTIDSRSPTFRQDSANFEELISTLGSQAFLAQVPMMKGMGALSNAEGAKLESALQSLSLRQSSDQLVTNLREVQRLMLKARKSLADRYGLPDTVPDTPAAASQGGAGSPNVDDIVKKYTGGASGNY